ncbi:Acetyl-coenzyme A synthetase [Planctomycetes bacterium Pla163]|uniref:Acetyl-coenzyme A synthetase n=1 Tax=Rohdeia mirabilis TaxID=2528008 RepID=A0A518D1P7_9BACT|nr:Acetyl-coenzyme A synthetase [Planctomycetes bacterium Pla163]
MSDREALWSPSPERAASSNMAAFARSAAGFDGLEIGAGDYARLHAWSIAEPRALWSAIWDFCGVVAPERGTEVVDVPSRMPGARWFEGARLNFAENLLRFRDERRALVEWNEDGRVRELSYAGLAREVARVQAGLRAVGVGVGDRVVGYLPNRSEAVIAMLATASLGAVWSSCSPDFGIQGVLDRFGQIAPKVLFAADSTLYAGKPRPYGDKVARVVDELRARADGQLAAVVLCGDPSVVPAAKGLEVTTFDAFGDRDATEPAFEHLPFDHPLYVMYSSGTTGLPKCMVHGAGGTLLQHAKELVLHTGLTRDDTIFYFTTCGWMMWNWLVSSLFTGATLVLYDGSPMAPDALGLWRLAEAEGVTVFGTSAKYLALLEKSGAKPGASCDLSRLRTILSTGSPLAPEGFDFVYRDVAPDVQLASIAGGTDIVSCFALGNPLEPVYRGQLQGPGLGMQVQVFGPDGRPLPVGEKGELVCSLAFPSMPVCFWDDPNGTRYHESYFARFPTVWCHGDWVERTEEGGIVFHGRSDTTLNPGGVRIGSAEVTRPVDDLDAVTECAVVGQDVDGDVRIVLFVVLPQGQMLDDGLRDTIRTTVRERTSPHHVPRVICQVPDLPRTLSGKISEAAIARTVNGQPVDNADALANPKVLEHFANRPELAV